MSNFTCPKCGSGLDVKPGTQMVTCGYCGTVTYIDRRYALFFYLLPFSINENAAKGIFKRWTASPANAKDLEAEAKITKFSNIFFPVFLFNRKAGAKVQAIVKPARGTTLPGLQNLVIPPGDIKVYDASISTGSAEVLKPDIAIDSYLPDLEGESIDQALVYFPLYQVSYTYKGTEYSLLIDGSSGTVYAGEAPQRSSVSYAGVMGLAFAFGFAGVILSFLTGIFLFLLLIVGGFFAGKILGHAVANKKPVVSGGNS
ncbi:MAG TPA: hypothetical protein O0X70_04820 [Methanocorpusculum sp.]|nr:hypothetical protein [Methanocorpusculum sp.]